MSLVLLEAAAGDPSIVTLIVALLAGNLVGWGLVWRWRRRRGRGNPGGGDDGAPRSDG